GVADDALDGIARDQKAKIHPEQAAEPRALRVERRITALRLEFENALASRCERVVAPAIAVTEPLKEAVDLLLPATVCTGLVDRIGHPLKSAVGREGGKIPEL